MKNQKGLKLDAYQSFILERKCKMCGLRDIFIPRNLKSGTPQNPLPQVYNFNVREEKLLSVGLGNSPVKYI